MEDDANVFTSSAIRYPVNCFHARVVKPTTNRGGQARRGIVAGKPAEALWRASWQIYPPLAGTSAMLNYDSLCLCVEELQGFPFLHWNNRRFKRSSQAA
jgi:hypothetical protein